MQFRLTCECGESITVSEGAAGVDMPCDCGRSIRVPSLAKLREQAGLEAVPITPETRIRGMITAGELPGTTCIACGADAAAHVPLLAVCEREYKAGGGRGDGFSPYLLLVPFGRLYAVMTSSRQNDEFHGRETVVPVPLALCDSCRQRIPGSVGVRPSAALGIALLVAGMFLLTRDRNVAGVVLVGGAIGLVVARVLAVWRRRSIRSALRRVSVYAELLKRFPEATVVPDRKSK